MSDVTDTNEAEVEETEATEGTETPETETTTTDEADAKDEADNGDSPEVKELKAEREKLLKSLNAARGDTKAEKKKAAELAAKIKAVEAAELTEIERLQAQLEEANAKNQKFFDVTVKSTVKSALKDADAQGSTDRLMKMMDLTSVEIDEDGDVVGVDEAVEAFKVEFPEFFKAADEEKPPAKATKPRGNIDPGPKTPAPKKLSFVEKLQANATKR